MKIVVPIMPRDLDEAQSIDISRFDDVDIIEWRADFLPKDDIMTVAPAIFEKFSGLGIWRIFFFFFTLILSRTLGLGRN